MADVPPSKWWVSKSKYAKIWKTNQVPGRNCAVTSAHFQLQMTICISSSGIWQLIASLSSWASILSLMTLLMGGLFALTTHYDKHIYPLTFRGLRTNGAIKSFNCALPHCLTVICALLGWGGVVMEGIPQSVTWVKAQGNFATSQLKMWNFFDSMCKVFIGHMLCGQNTGGKNQV